ncbi:hypothetical protein BGZ65_009844 [Modicella reniformis]|uniref:Uncharacterized protein n=1 Tax=Modicella reniformis TaxID=1440133 RepID=A0A9P6MM70_9FUNG|nr:hypothetical protein BGZ65_009844 [Modicella reniformis]
MTRPTLANPCAEDEAKYIDISELQSSEGVDLVFGGTDYGVATMSRTVPLTMDVIQTHLNRFWLLSDRNEEASDPPAEPTYSPLPPAFSITAPQLDSTSHTNQMRRRREKKLRQNEPVKAALQAVSRKSFQAAASMTEIDEVQAQLLRHPQCYRIRSLQRVKDKDSHQVLGTMEVSSRNHHEHPMVTADQVQHLDLYL